MWLNYVFTIYSKWSHLFTDGDAHVVTLGSNGVMCSVFGIYTMTSFIVSIGIDLVRLVDKNLWLQVAPEVKAVKSCGRGGQSKSSLFESRRPGNNGFKLNVTRAAHLQLLSSSKSVQWSHPHKFPTTLYFFDQKGILLQ